MTETKCAGTTQAGKPCNRNATETGYCATHADQTPAAANPSSGIGNPDTHITINSIVNYIFGGLTLVFMVLGGLFLMLGAETLANFMDNYYGPVGDFLREGGAIIGVMTIFIGLIAGVPQIIAGVGLAKRSESGRILALVVAAVHILYGLTLLSGNVTAVLNLGFGGYAFWSLLHPTVVARFREGTAA